MRGTIPLPGQTFQTQAIPGNRAPFEGRLDVLVVPSGAATAHAFLMRGCPAQLFAGGRHPNAIVCHRQASSHHEATQRANQLHGPRSPVVACRKARARLQSSARAAPRATRTTRTGGASIEYSRTALALRSTGACSSEPEPSCGGHRECPVSYAPLSSHFPMMTYRKSSPAMQRTAPHSA
jgi:hypothetical protein